MSDYRLILSDLQTTPIVHCHIPRTGGMSVDYYFRAVIGDDNCRRLGTDEDFVMIRDPKSEFYNFKWKYLSAHLCARQIADIMGGRKFYMFTIIRDPFEREASAFKNIVEHCYAEHSHEIKTFDDYLAFKESDPREKNLQCAFIQMGQKPAPSVALELLQFLASGYSIVTLERNFVLQEYMRTSMNSHCVIETHNVSVTKLDLTVEQKVRLEKLIERDLELYELVQSAERIGSLLNDWRVGWQLIPGR
jgi:hypothetical protein